MIRAGRWPREDAKGIDHAKFITLSRLLPGSKVDAAKIRDMECIAEESEDGPWLYVVPDELVRQIADTPPRSTPAIVEAWAKTEEFRLDNATVSDAQDYFEMLQRLGRISLERKEPLLMWMCL